MARGKSICLFSAKGGTGKTTLAINLAGEISKQEKSVVILDLDLYNGSVALSLNKEITKTIYNFVDDYNNNRYEDMSLYLTKYNEYISFLPCPKDPRQANKIDTKYIDILIDKCLFLFDVVIIDMGNVFDEISVFTLDKVDTIMFVTTNDAYSLKNIKNVLSILKDNNIDKYKILLNNSINKDQNYYSLYDIKNILNNNIDYIISNKFYQKNIDNLVFNGEIATIKYPKLEDNKVFKIIASSLLKAGDKNE